MSRSIRWLTAVAVGAAALVVFSAGVVGAKPSGKHDSGTAYAAITHTVGTTTEYIAGNSTDKLFGSGAVTYKAKVGVGSKAGTYPVSAKVTSFFKNGSLSGTASGTLTANPDGSVTLSGGKITLRNGAGGQKGHTLVATFTASGKGILGPFVFHYKGTYK
jgi:hypothetical protein